MQEFVKANMIRYREIIKSQIFLQENGVSFSYTDSISFFERLDLIDCYSEFIDMKNKRQRELERGG